MGPDLKIFNYKTDLKRQRVLFLECFPENTGTPVVTEDYYLWKFHGSGRQPGSFEYIALIDSEIVGYYAAIDYPYYYFGKEIKTGMVCDVMTSVKARGQGVFTTLSNFALKNLNNENLGFLTGFPIRKEVVPGHRKAGWDFPFIIPMYGKFLTLNTFLISRGFGWARYLLNPVLSLTELFVKILRRSNSSVSVEEYSSEDIDNIPGFGDLLGELQQQAAISLKKDISFMKWRLGGPDKTYRIVLLKVGPKTVGYMIGRYLIKEKVPCFGILDFSLLSGFEKFSSVLMRETEKIAKTMHAELILIMILRRYARSYRFFRNGWIKTPYNFSFILRKTGSETEREKLLDTNNWFLTWLNSDDL
jgi:hypothetical protein